MRFARRWGNAQVCPNNGISVTHVDMTDLEAVRRAIIPGKTKLVHIESPSNPRMQVRAASPSLLLAARPVPFTAPFPRRRSRDVHAHRLAHAHLARRSATSAPSARWRTRRARWPAWTTASWRCSSGRWSWAPT